MRRRGPAYPVWIGILALAGLSILWALRPPKPKKVDEPAALTSTVPADSPSSDRPDSPASAAPESNRTIPELRWQIEGAPALSGKALGDCLRAGGWARLTAHGGGKHPLSVTHGSLILPSMLTVQDGITQIRTRLPAKRHQGIALHTAIAGCLPGTTLKDSELGLLATAEKWPSSRRDAGLRAGLLMQITPGADQLLLKGLGRLGLKNLVYPSADTPDARRRLMQAGTLLLLQDDPAATTLPFGDAKLALTPLPHADLKNAHRIDLPAPVAPASAPSTPASVSNTQVRRRPNRRKPIRRKPTRPPEALPARPKTTPRPTPATPRWRPDYVD